MLLAVLLPLMGSPGSAHAGTPDRKWLDLLKQQQFDKLENELQRLQADYDGGACQECEANAPYFLFATSDPLVGQRLQEWVAQHPNSVPARFARGRYLNHVAWIARGSGTVSETSNEQFAEMRRLQTAAIEDLLWVVEHEPKTPLAYADLIYIATAQSGEIAAAQIYDRALQSNPDSPAIYRARVWSLSPWWQSILSWGDAEARQQAYILDLQQKYGGKPGFGWLDGYADYMKAEADWRNGDWEAAIAAYGRALAVREHATYLLARADAYADIEAYDKADADRKRALTIAPNDTDALYENGKLDAWRCRSASAADICKAAEAELDAVVAADPLEPKYLLQRALHLAAMGRTDEARRDMEDAQVYGKNAAWVQGMSASILSSFDKPAAKLAYQRAITLAPDDLSRVEKYLRFLADTADCDFLPLQITYRKICSQTDQCRLIGELDGMVESFQQNRRQNCAAQNWTQPAASMALPE
jgi:tetratricopeptide (TPR) repeat protein